MERTYVSKGLKSTNVLKHEGDDNLSAGPPREGMEAVSLSNKNYFSPPIMDVWPQILENVTDPNDIFALINTAPVFRSLLENRKVAALLPLVLPVLMKTKYLESRDFLNCRFISKSVKASVDDALVEQQPDWVPESTWLLFDVAHSNTLLRLLDLPDDFTGNPFILRKAMLLMDDSIESPLYHYVNTLRILQRFGHELYDAYLGVGLLDDSPRTRMRMLKQALSYLPNVKKLSLSFTGYRFSDAIPCNNFRTSHRRLPVLQHLEELDVHFMNMYAEYLPPSSFVRPIVLACRKQITRLSCESYAFRGLNWRPFRFRQLRELTVYFKTDLDLELIGETFRNVAKLDCPQLKKLDLYSMGDGLIITKDTFEALDNFRNTLKELDLGVIEEGSLQLFQVDPINILGFPQMTTLELNAVNTRTELMHLFRVMFTKLEELHFEQPPWRYQLVEPSLEKIRNDYFTIFPNLKRIIWNGGTSSNRKGEVLTRRTKF